MGARDVLAEPVCEGLADLLPPALGLVEGGGEAIE